MGKQVKISKETAQYHAPDGFFPDGRSRPWREIRIMSIEDGMARFRYVDTGTVGHCPVSGLQYVEPQS